MMIPLIVANVGVPMIFLGMPAMLAALLPIVLVETAVARRLTALRLKSCAAGVLLANLASTLLGVPLAWGLMLGVEALTTGGAALGISSPLQKLAAVTLQAAWLVPYEEHLYWMIPGAAVTLLIPAFLLSVWIERFICLRLWVRLERAKTTRAVWIFNAISYGLLAMAVLVWLTGSLVSAK